MEVYLGELETLKERLEQDLGSAPEGYVRITGCKDKKVFYWVIKKSGEIISERYLKSNEKELTRQLFQKSYDRRLLYRVKEEISALNSCMCELSDGLDEIYEVMPEIRKSFVVPYRLTDEEFVEQWINTPFVGNTSYPENLKHTTQNGELVRSKSERSIADMLLKYNIPYKYEAPLFMKGLGVIHPDFTILDICSRKNVYWEHFGYMDDIDYVNKAINRYNTYILNGFVLGKDFIITMETKDCPLDQPDISRMIENLLIGDGDN